MTLLVQLVSELEAAEAQALRECAAQCETSVYEEIPAFDLMGELLDDIIALPVRTDEEFQAKARAARIARRHFANAA